MLRRLQVHPRALDRSVERDDAAEIVLPLAVRRDAHVLELEILDPAFGRPQVLLVIPDLVIQELDGRLRILSLVTQARLDEDREQRLDDLPRLARVLVAIADHVQVRGNVAFEPDRLRDRVDQFLALGIRRRAQVEVRHADQPLDIRAADQRAAHQRDLLVEIRLDREPREKRPKQRLRVDVYAGRGLVAFGNAVNEPDADDCRDPRRCESDPAPVPDAPQDAEDLLKDFLHVLASLPPGRTAFSVAVRTSFAE